MVLDLSFVLFVLFVGRASFRSFILGCAVWCGVVLVVIFWRWWCGRGEVDIYIYSRYGNYAGAEVTAELL